MYGHHEDDICGLDNYQMEAGATIYMPLRINCYDFGNGAICKIFPEL